MTRLLAFVLSLSAATACAAEAPMPGRYAFVPAEVGTLRLDTRTGAVELCAGAAASLACRPLSGGAGDRDAEVAARLAAMEARIASLERRAGGATDRRALTRVAALADRMMGRLIELVRDAKRPHASGRL